MVKTPSYFGFCWGHLFAFAIRVFAKSLRGQLFNQGSRLGPRPLIQEFKIRFYEKSEGKLMIQEDLPIIANRGKLFNAKESDNWNSFIIRYARNNSGLELKFKVSWSWTGIHHPFDDNTLSVKVARATINLRGTTT